MDSDMLKKQALSFNRARNNLLGMIAFTLINLLLIAFAFDLQFFFSAFVPQILLVFLYDISIGIGLVVALLALSVYLLCYFLSKKYRVFILIALILFLMDFLLMLGMMFLLNAFGDFIFNIIFHGWITFYLFTGTVAWVKLKNTTPEQVEAIRQEAEKAEQETELNSALDTITPPEDTKENDSKDDYKQ